MLRSESINEIATALAKAQGSNDRFSESTAIVPIARQSWPQRRRNQNSGQTMVQRFFEKIVFGMSDCWYWRGALHNLGYGLFEALGEHKAHRVSYRLFKGPIPNAMDVLHTCDVRNCVNPDHLLTGTHADNMRDMVAKGRGRNAPRFGEQNKQSKLTAAQVAEIRQRYAAGGSSMRALGSEFGVGAMNICRIVNNELWRVS